MFEQSDDQQLGGTLPGQPINDQAAASAPSTDGGVSTPAPGTPGGFMPPAPVTDNTAAPAPVDEPASSPTAPVTQDDTAAPDTAATPPDSFSPFNQPAEETNKTPATTTEEPSGLTASTNDLIRIKQEALQNLSPLVDHLDQTPEERFRTTMMMIQATDDSSKIKDAYDIAQQITDEKIKAQALLDVVNEINYFTQTPQESEEK